jgi:predicted Co/Zn/Cd cation transporter (cation efflux family)
MDNSKNPPEVRLEEVKEPKVDSTQLSPTWVRRARRILYISIFFSLCAAASGLGIGLVDKSISVLSFAFESSVDVMMSLLILWRLQETSVQVVEVRNTHSLAHTYKLLFAIAWTDSGQIGRKKVPKQT